MWKLDDTRIYVQKIGEGVKQTIARLSPLHYKTIHHIFGWESDVLTLSAVIVGDTDLAALKAMAKDGNTHTLLYWEGQTRTVLVSNVDSDRVKCVCQTIRQDLPKDSPVYNVELELYYVE